MIDELPILPYPAWLKDIDARSISEDEFPLTDILAQSLYYPACGFDGDPIRHLGGNIYSFIYIDYGRRKYELNSEIDKGFSKYFLLERRTITEQELNPKGINPPNINSAVEFENRRNLGIFNFYVGRRTPYCEWFVFERDMLADELHGPKRFSLLYLNADGAATYPILYNANNIRPEVICIINAGHDAFNSNWTDFKNPMHTLARIARENSAGLPKFLLYDFRTTRLPNFLLHDIRNGNSGCWPYYDTKICSLDITDPGMEEFTDDGSCRVPNGLGLFKNSEAHNM